MTSHALYRSPPPPPWFCQLPVYTLMFMLGICYVMLFLCLCERLRTHYLGQPDHRVHLATKDSPAILPGPNYREPSRAYAPRAELYLFQYNFRFILVGFRPTCLSCSGNKISHNIYMSFTNPQNLNLHIEFRGNEKA